MKNVWFSGDATEQSHANLHAPHTGRVVQGRVQLPNSAEVRDVSDVPHVNAVVAVDAGQPAVRGVVGHSHGVGIAAPWRAGEQLTEEEDKGQLKNTHQYQMNR